MIDKKDFYKKLAHANELDNADKALFVLCREGLFEDNKEMTASEIAAIMRTHGIANPNSTHLSSRIRKKGQTLKGKKGFYLKADAKTNIKTKVAEILKIVLPDDDLGEGYLASEIWGSTRGYIEKVCQQINGCYKHDFCDGAAVLIRRLMETLIIECYENQKREKEISDSSGQYFMLNDLIDKTLASDGLKLGRETQNSLRPIKKFGDLSAHTRRYNARKSDLDKISRDVRLVMEELINLSNIKR